MSPKYVPPQLRNSSIATETSQKSARWSDPLSENGPMYLPGAFQEQVPPDRLTIRPSKVLPGKDQRPPPPKLVYSVLFHHPALLDPRQRNPWVSSTSTTIISTHLAMTQANRAAQRHWETWPKTQTIGGAKPVNWQGGLAGTGAGPRNLYHHTGTPPYRAWGWLHSEWQWYRIEVQESRVTLD